jgi:hypothetical protein
MAFARPTTAGVGAAPPAAASPRPDDGDGRGAPGRRGPPARLAFYDLVTGDEIGSFQPGLSVGFEAVLTPERPYGPTVCGAEPMTEVGAKLALLDGDAVATTYWYRNQVMPWDASAQAARYAHFDAWVDPNSDRVERRDAWEFRAFFFRRVREAKAYALRATVVVTCGDRAPVTLAEGTLPWDLSGPKLAAFGAALAGHETKAASFNRLRPSRPKNAALERQLAELLRRNGYDARRVVVVGDWGVQRDEDGTPRRRAVRAQAAYHDRNQGGVWVTEVSFEQASDGRGWGELRYAGPTGGGDFTILRKNLRR